MVLERKLDSSVKLPCYASQADALLNESVGTIPLFLGTSCSVIFGEPSASDLPSSVAAGDVFHGKVNYLKKPASTAGAGNRPGGYPVSFFCTGAKAAKPPSAAKDSGSSPQKKTATGVDSKSEEKLAVFEMDDSLREAIRDAKLKYLSDLGGKEVTKEVLAKDLSQHPFHLAFAHMLGEYPDHVPLRLSGLDYIMKCANAVASASANEDAAAVAVPSTTKPATLSSSTTVSDEDVDKEEKIDGSGSDLTARSQQYLHAAIALSDEIFEMIDKAAIMSELGVLIDSSDPSASKQRNDIKAIRGQVSYFNSSYPVFCFWYI